MKVKDGIIGLLIGDALGVPVEFKSREYLHKNPITKMEGHGTYNMPSGTWSDDTSMTLATMASIVTKNTIDYTDIIEEFCEFVFNGKYVQYYVFDYGNTTVSALEKYCSGTPALESGGTSDRSNGNGSLMRILPLAYIPDITYETIENISGLTHAHKRSKIACVLYIEIARSMLKNDLTIIKHVKNAFESIKKYYKNENELEYFKKIFNLDFSGGVSSGGYVLDSLESTIYCLLTTDNYQDAVLKAVNLGGDTDTTAAICGGLAGIYYGYEAIPIDWINTVEQIDKVLSLCEKYEEYCDES